MKVFLQSIFGQLLLTPYIFWRGYQAIPAKKSWRIPYILFFVLELLLFFTGYFFRHHLPENILIGILYICNTWYIASLYITMYLLLLEILRFTNKRFPWFPECIKKNYPKVKLYLFGFVLLFISGLMVKAYHNATYPTVRHLHITLPRGSSPLDSLTISMMSDLHIGEIIGKKHAQRYVELSNAQNPDLVVMVGDILDYESRHAEIQQVEKVLEKLKAPLGVYAVNGNHEYRANRYAKYRWIRETGAILLIDSVAMPESAFYLVGRDDKVNRGRKSLNKLLEDLDRSKPIIVLDHQPWDIAEMVMNRIDLGLHGHTHNGQFWPYPLVLKLVYPCSYGYYQKGPSQFYISSGIGFAGPPYRVGTRSELVVLHIRFESEE